MSRGVRRRGEATFFVDFRAGVGRGFSRTASAKFLLGRAMVTGFLVKKNSAAAPYAIA